MNLPENSIDMSHERAFCAQHGEPLRAQYPNGAPYMIVKLFEEVFLLKDILVKARELSGKDEPDPQVIEQLLDETPACCRVSSETLLRLYEGAEFGVTAKCVNCRQKKLGSPYKTSTQNAKHLCFTCVIYQMVPLQ